MVVRATPTAFWLDPAGVDGPRGTVDEAASLDSDSVTGYGEKYLNVQAQMNGLKTQGAERKKKVRTTS